MKHVASLPTSQFSRPAARSPVPAALAIMHATRVCRWSQIARFAIRAF
jgi:hypothetical protein